MGRSKKMWVQEAFSKNKGALHRSLKVPMGDTIPEAKLEKAMHSKNTKLRKRAQLAETASHFHHKEKGGRVRKADGGLMSWSERLSQNPAPIYDPNRAYLDRSREYAKTLEAKQRFDNSMSSMRAGNGAQPVGMVDMKKYPNWSPQPQTSTPMQNPADTGAPGTLKRGGRAPRRK